MLNEALVWCPCPTLPDEGNVALFPILTTAPSSALPLRLGCGIVERSLVDCPESSVAALVSFSLSSRDVPQNAQAPARPLPPDALELVADFHPHEGVPERILTSDAQLPPGHDLRYNNLPSTSVCSHPMAPLPFQVVTTNPAVQAAVVYFIDVV